MSEVYPLLARLSINRQFMSDFLSAATPCFALGMLEERKRSCGFLALRPNEVITPEISDAGFLFGHSLIGNADFEVVHFAFHFYGFKTYNVLVNPNNPLVRTVLTSMVKTKDYFFFALDSQGGVTLFRSECGEANLVGLKIQSSAHPTLGDHRCPVPASGIIFPEESRASRCACSSGSVEIASNIWMSPGIVLS